MKDNRNFINFININVKQCIELKRFLEKSFVPEYFYGVNVLMKMLDDKTYFLQNITSNSLDSTKSKIEKQDKLIYNQILLIQNALWKDYNDKKHKNSNVNTKKYKQKIDNKDQIKKIINNNHFKKYIDDRGIQTMQDTIKNILNFIKNNQWISTFLFMSIGFLFYMTYFVFSISYLPQISQGDFFYILVISSSIGIFFVGYFSLFFSIAPLCYKNMFKDIYFEKQWQKPMVFLVAFLATPIYIFLILCFGLEPAMYQPLLLLIVFVAISLLIAICQLCKNDLFQEKSIKDQIFYFLSNTVPIFLLMFAIHGVIYIIVYHSSQNTNFEINYAVTIFVAALYYFFTLEVENIAHTLLITFAFCCIVSLTLFSSNFAKIFNIGNIEYKYLVMDRVALDKMPQYISRYRCVTKKQKDKPECVQGVTINSFQNGILTYENSEKIYINKNLDFEFFDKSKSELDVKIGQVISYENKTLSYIENNQTKTQKHIAMKPKKLNKTYIAQSADSTIRLYNIKALSTLGKFYYLQAQNGKKFKILSSYIHGGEVK